jgi:ligand-binding sensor domain-containing protein/signal transduction histidine kinase
MKKFFISIITLFVLSGNADQACAQQWTKFVTEDGLIGNSIWFIREDARGYLWFGTTFHGLTRYDGTQFQSYDTQNGLVSDNIYFILTDRSGKVWLATDRGVTLFDGRQFWHIDEEDGLSSRNVNFMSEDDHQNIWFATDEGVSKFDGQTFQNLDDQNIAGFNITYVLNGQKGNIWFARDDGILNYDQKKFRFHPLPAHSTLTNLLFEDQFGNLWIATETGLFLKPTDNDSIIGPLFNNYVSDIMEDHFGKIWLSAPNKGVFQFNQQNQSFNPIKSLSRLNVHVMSEDSKGNIWFGGEQGIGKYNGKIFQIFTEINAQPINFVRVIWEDSDENIWIGTEDGVYKYSLNYLTQYTVENNLSDNHVQAICEDREGKLWLGTNSGLDVFERDNIQSLKLVNENILSIFQDRQGTLWIGTSNGVFKNFQPFRQLPSLLNTAVRNIYQDQNGHIWFTTANAIVRFDGVNYQTFSAEDISTSMVDRAGKLWIGTWTNGLYRYDRQGDRIQYTVSEGLLSNHITWLLESQDGSIWIGAKGAIPQPGIKQISSGGISRFSKSRISNFTVEDGLLSEFISDALIDNDDYLWLATDKGVIKCVYQDSLILSNLTKADGLISNFATALFLDSHGNLWIGTDKGASRYDGANCQNISLEAYLRFGNIENFFQDSQGSLWFTSTSTGIFRYILPTKAKGPRIFLTQIDAGQLYVGDFKLIHIPTSVKRIIFEYKAISFKTRPEKLKYYNQLEGVDTGWQPSQSQTRVYYTDVIPGQYQFTVRAMDQDLQYSTSPAKVDIVVYEPFYRTSLFLGILFLIAGTIIGGGSYLVTQLIKQRRLAAEFREKLIKQEKAEAIQTAKMSSLRKLVAGVAHEVNNPIGAIISGNDSNLKALQKIISILSDGQFHTLKEEHLAKTLKVLQNINQSNQIASQKIARIVSELKCFVRLDEAQWQILIIHECLNNAISLIGAEHDQRIKIKKEFGQIPPIYCSPSNLNQVYVIILTNAVEAISGDGEVFIRTYEENHYVCIEIEDTGIGIQPEHIDKIFDPGFTTKGVKVGVGLGLSICHQIIVDEHHGHIDVSSQVGNGTKFTIKLPNNLETIKEVEIEKTNNS